MNEIFKPVKGYEGIYEISNLGRVKSLARIDKRGWNRKEKFLKQSVNVRGYAYIMTFDGKAKVVHRLVCESFIGDPPSAKHITNHKNAIKTDNRLENLEWVTYSQNSQHAIDMGLRHTPKGENNHNAVLTQEQVRKIRSLYSKKVKLSCTHKMLAEKFGVSTSTIYGVLKNKTYREEGTNDE